jgi:choline-sulfatase
MTRWILPTLCALACSPAERAPAPVDAVPPGERPSFMIIDIDSLRADRVLAQRGGRPVAPFMAALAGESVRFDAAVAQAAWTVPSLTALLTGRYPPALELEDDAMSWLDAETRTLPEILGWYGYGSAVLFGETLPGSFAALARGFDAVDMEPSSPRQAYEQRVCSWLEQAPPDPFLLLVHNVDLHAVAAPPPASFQRGWLGRDPISQAHNLDQAYADARGTLSEAEARAYIQALYDANLAWYDRAVEAMVGCLEEAGLAERTVVIVTSNHGEDLFDHGVLGHGRHHWQSVLHIPLLVRDGRHPTQPRTVKTRVQTIDLAPTLLALAGATADSAMQGRSLVPLLDDPHAPWPARDISSFSSLLAASLIRGRYKLAIHSTSDGPPGASPDRLGAMAPGATASFWDLHSDPRERHDLAEQAPAPMVAMQRDLLDFVDQRVLATRAAEAEPVNETFLQALRDGGYWEQVQRDRGTRPDEPLPREGDQPR